MCHARAFPTNRGDFLIRGQRLITKLLSRGHVESRQEASFKKLHVRHNNLINKYAFSVLQLCHEFVELFSLFSFLMCHASGTPTLALEKIVCTTMAACGEPGAHFPGANDLIPAIFSTFASIHLCT